MPTVVYTESAISNPLLATEAIRAPAVDPFKLLYITNNDGFPFESCQHIHKNIQTYKFKGYVKQYSKTL